MFDYDDELNLGPGPGWFIGGALVIFAILAFLMVLWFVQ